MIDLSTVKNIHFIGIGGISNSGIAEILAHNGYHISGSDMSTSSITEQLASKGIVVFIGHQAENIKDADLVVYTAAVNENNPELVFAHSKGIPCISRAEMLGQLMLEYKNSIAVAGTHGKTSTTSMITRLLNEPIINPTALIGGYFKDIKSNVKIGSNDVFITEACEYKGSFLSFFPNIGIVLNVDEDHLDYYENLDAIIDAFIAFSKNIDKDGLLILNGDDYNAKKLLSHYEGRVLTFGLSDNCHLTARNITYNDSGCAQFSVYYNGEMLSKISLGIPGQHNVYNALAAYAVGVELSMDAATISKRLNSFSNAERRFEVLGHFNGATVVDDYAHHPNEIRATLDAATRMTNINKIYAIFQPHTFSRTKELLHEFSNAFKGADKVILCDIYAAREDDPGDISSLDLLRALKKENVNCDYFKSFDAITDYLSSHVNEKDLILTMGAGNVNQIGKALLQKK